MRFSMFRSLQDKAPVRGFSPVVRRDARLVALMLAVVLSACVCLFAGSARAAVGACGPAVFGVCEFESPITTSELGPLATQAGSHPYALTTTMVFNNEIEEEEPIEEENGKGESVPIGDPALTGKIYGDSKDVEVNLPAGVVVNPTAAPRKCTEAQFETQEGSAQGGGCPLGSVVGVVEVFTMSELGQFYSPVYSMVPPPGIPAEFGVNPASIGLIAHIVGKVRTGGDYGLSGSVTGIIQSHPLYKIKLTLWGDPTNPSHDRERGLCSSETAVLKEIEEETYQKKVEKALKNHMPLPQESKFFFRCPLARGERTSTPLLTMPDSCTGGPLATTMSVDSWQEPGNEIMPAPFVSPAVTGCQELPFHPSLNAEPSPNGAGTESPSGLNVDLKIPQNESIEGRAEADLKKAVVSLPAGIAISPSAANGLGACPAEGPDGFNLHEQETESNGEKHAPRGHCPDSSKIGTVEVLTPLLEKPLTGSVFIAQPKCGGSGQPGCTEESASNGELFGLYLEVEGQGAIVKLAGTVSANPSTGQLTTTFDNNPQLPFNELKLKLFSGPRAPLITPSDCGTYTTRSLLSPWSGTIPVPWPSDLTINQGCTHAFTPTFTAGTTNNQAGAYSPFSVTLSRQDGEQRLGGVQVIAPQGLLATLKSVVQCPEPQASQGACGPESMIGETTVAVGPGTDTYWVKGGKVYLTGPYKGSPFGLSIVVPAVAGPFNLGNEVVRARIDVDSHTAQAIVTSDALPTIKDGIPLDIRTINVTINKTGFMFNPTNCSPAGVTGTLESTSTTKVAVSSPFEAANCASLPFKPSFKVSTQASTSKANGASLTVKVGSSTGQANIAKVRVTLPKQLPARLTTLQKACTEAQFNTNPAGCPIQSDVGNATAITPLLAHPLTGPAYLVSHGGAAFPDLVFVLQGEGITLYLDGNTNIKKGITTSTFNSVPDAPISSFETVFPEGPHSVLATNIPAKAKNNMCGQVLTMPTTITGQNGAVTTQTTKISVTGCPKAKKKTKAKHKGHGKKGKK